jgi:hypothetical protein
MLLFCLRAGDSIALVSHVFKEVQEGKDIVHIHIHLSSCSETTLQGNFHHNIGPLAKTIVLNVGGGSSLGLHP